MKGVHLARAQVSLSLLDDLSASGSVYAATELSLKHSLESLGIYFGDNLLPTCAQAFVAPIEQINRWAKDAERFVATIEALADDIIADPRSCAELDLSAEALEFVRVDPGYRRTCVLCRPDGIPVGNDVKFVELNSDSPAMMMFLDIVARCILELDSFAGLRTAVKPPRAADILLDVLLECYREFAGSGREPTIAITDWEGQKTRFEHQRIAEHFRDRGYETIVCDPRALQYRDGELRCDRIKIDLIYRRALAAELIERRADVAPLLEAYRAGKVCMVNPLRSSVVGMKSVLSRSEVLAKGHVPRTLVLDNEAAREMVSAAPSRWAIKRSQGHGGNGVVLPEPENAAAWQHALEASRSEIWIAQEYLEIPHVALRVVENGTETSCDKYYNWNPFVFGGRYAGSIVRVSDSPLINITLGGGLLPTFAY